MMITVKLILSDQFPEKNGVWADEDFAKVNVVSLINKNVREIDNLDLFDNIAELNLQHNKITSIENISHLLKLRSLDLSDNLIDEVGLYAESLPPNLKVLNLKGNPCVASWQAMQKLTHDYPLLRVIYESESSSTSNIVDSEFLNPATSVASSMESAECLDSEAVLRAVVDRKCRLQALAPLDVQSALQSLEKEYDELTLASKNRRGLPASHQVLCDEDVNRSALSAVDVTMEHVPLYRSRLGALQGGAGCGGEDFFAKLRTQAFKTYDEKIKENKTGESCERNSDVSL